MKVSENMKKTRKGFSLVELLIAVVVLGILGAMLIAAGTAAQNKARISVASNDIDSARNAVYTALMMNPSVAQYTDSSAGWKKNLIDIINAELDETWQWDLIDSANAGGPSGAIAQTRTMRDPWKNPYTLFAYTDSYTTTFYADETSGNTQDAPTHMLNKSDSSMTLVIASAGPNGTGVGKGLNGEISPSGAPATAADIPNMINNTDGIDDIGVIIQLVNGSTTQATFGWSNAMFGAMEHINWYFCGQSAEGATISGKYSQVQNGSAQDCTAITRGSSLRLHPTLEKFPSTILGATKSAPQRVDQ